MSRAAKNREKYLHDVFIQRNSKIEDYEDDDGEFDDAISLEKTQRRKGGLSKSQKNYSRLHSDSRYAIPPQTDERDENDSETIRLKMFNIEKKLQ